MYNAWLAEFPAILDSFYQCHKHLYRGGGWGVVWSHKVAVTAELCIFQGEMAHKEAPLHLNCHKT